MSADAPGDPEVPRLPTDLASLARHALTLTTEIEKVWSQALDADELRVAHKGTTAALQALANALVGHSRDRDRRLQEAGVDVRLHEWPPSPEFVLAFDGQAASKAERFRLAMVSQLVAVDLLIRAIGVLMEPSGVEVDLVAGVERHRWWESGGFALARSRARLVESLTAELHATEQAVMDEPVESDAHPWERRAFDAAQAAGVAYARGDPEGALLHILRSARATIAQIDETAAQSFTWDRLEVIPDLATAGQLLGRAQGQIEAMARGAGTFPEALLLAGALLPYIQRWAVAPPGPQLATAIHGDTRNES